MKKSNNASKSKGWLVFATIVLLTTGCNNQEVQFGPGAHSTDRTQYSPQGQSDQYAVAFEDMFPKAGDEDFNDFLTNFHVSESVNALNQITGITIDFYPRAVGASYDHSFLLVLSGVKDQPSNISLKTQPLFNGTASVTLTHFSPGGAVLDSQAVDPNHDITVFASTHAIFSKTITGEVINTASGSPYLAPLQLARVEITLANPELNPMQAKIALDYSKMRMILHVKDSNKDVDVVDADPTNIDSKGYPFGFVIPTNWQWPTEGTAIDSVYPGFAQYRDYLLARALNPQATVSPAVMNWFTSPSGSANLYPLVPAVPLLPQ